MSVPSSRVAVDREGKLHVVYTDGTIRYAQRTGDGWSVQNVADAQVDPLADGIGARFSLDLDGLGRAHVLFANQATGDVLSYATNALGSWLSELVGLPPRGLALALDDSDTVHLTFVDGATETLRYATREVAGDWELRHAYRGACEALGDMR